MATPERKGSDVLKNLAVSFGAAIRSAITSADTAALATFLDTATWVKGEGSNLFLTVSGNTNAATLTVRPIGYDSYGDKGNNANKVLMTWAARTFTLSLSDGAGSPEYLSPIDENNFWDVGKADVALYVTAISAGNVTVYGAKI